MRQGFTLQIDDADRFIFETRVRELLSGLDRALQILEEQDEPQFGMAEARCPVLLR